MRDAVRQGASTCALCAKPPLAGGELCPEHEAMAAAEEAVSS